METAIRWSPNSTISGQRFLLVDVNGRTFRTCEIEDYDGSKLRYKTTLVHSKIPPFRAFDWSPKDENLTAVGQSSGEASVLRFNDTSACFSVPPKHQRVCNAVTFNKSSLLAVGLERVRNDFCLNLWDLNQRLDSSLSPKTKSSVEPCVKFASSEAITSVKFFSHPDLLVAGVKAACLRIYDLRENTGNPSWQAPTGNVYNIAIDHQDDNYFASTGRDKETQVQVWDCRGGVTTTFQSFGSSFTSSMQQNAVLDYKSIWSSHTSIWSLRYCKSRRGLLGVLASDGDFRVFETKQEQMSRTKTTTDYQQSFESDTTLEQTQLFTSGIQHIEFSYEHAKHRRHEKNRIVAFDFTNLGGIHGRPCAITLRGNHEVDIRELRGPPPLLSLSVMGNIATRVNQRREYCNQNAGLKTSLLHDLLLSGDGELTNGYRAEKQAGLEQPSLRECLAHTNLSRYRCIQGYLFNCRKNIDIIKGNGALEAMWGWIARAKGNAADNGMVAEKTDLSYLGILQLWNEDLGPRPETRILGSLDQDVDVGAVIESLTEALQLPDINTRDTDYSATRRLCLHTLGLALSYQGLENLLTELGVQSHNTRAAMLALVYDRPKLAVSVLQVGPSSSTTHREISLALAGHTKGQHDPLWSETTLSLASSLSDPYARAILTLVGTGSWDKVLQDEILPAQDSLAIALIHLSDSVLTEYLDGLSSKAVVAGDVSAVPLTGLAEPYITPLMQNYMLRTFDLQSCVLALSFTFPRYFASKKVEMWREEYRALLNIHRLFLQRVQFDVQSSQLSISAHRNRGKPLLSAPSKQISIKCVNCDQVLDRNPLHSSTTITSATTGEQNAEDANTSIPQRAVSPAPSGVPHRTTIFGDPRSGTVCPQCGKHLPRCVICMHWLGQPDSRSRGANERIAANQSTHTNGFNKEERERKVDELMKDFITACRKCWHMSHEEHSRSWFNKHRECPVPDCDCHCGEA